MVFIKADMVELADTMDLGSIGHPCRFESCYPHQQNSGQFLPVILFILKNRTRTGATAQSGGKTTSEFVVFSD